MDMPSGMNSMTQAQLMRAGPMSQPTHMSQGLHQYLHQQQVLQSQAYKKAQTKEAPQLSPQQEQMMRSQQQLQLQLQLQQQQQRKNRLALAQQNTLGRQQNGLSQKDSPQKMGRVETPGEANPEEIPGKFTSSAAVGDAETKFMLSQEFTFIFRECSSSDVLQLLKDNWHYYF